LTGFSRPRLFFSRIIPFRFRSDCWGRRQPLARFSKYEDNHVERTWRQPVSEQRPVKFAIDLDPAQEVGVFADFANIWNTPTTFVLDFLSVRFPAQDIDSEGEPSVALVSSKVAGANESRPTFRPPQP